MRRRKNGRCIMTTSEKAKIIAACEANAVPYDKIDFSEIPEITDFSNFKPLAMHSEYFKPLKESVTIRLDKALVQYFRSKGKGWQTKVNDFLVKAYRQGQI